MKHTCMSSVRMREPVVVRTEELVVVLSIVKNLSYDVNGAWYDCFHMNPVLNETRPRTSTSIALTFLHVRPCMDSTTGTSKNLACLSRASLAQDMICSSCLMTYVQVDGDHLKICHACDRASARDLISINIISIRPHLSLPSCS